MESAAGKSSDDRRDQERRQASYIEEPRQAGSSRHCRSQLTRSPSPRQTELVPRQPSRSPARRLYWHPAARDQYLAADAIARSGEENDIKGSGEGKINCVYIHLGGAADLVAVAADLRNHGPTIILMICEEQSQAVTMEQHLSVPGFDHSPSVEGKRCGRPSPDQLQYSYCCIRSLTLVVAGRRGIVQEVTEKAFTSSCSQGKLLIADVGFNVSHCNQLSMNVAVWDTKAYDNEQFHLPFLETAKVLVSKRVRLVGGEFQDTLNLAVRSLRNTVSVRVAAAEIFREKSSAEAEPEYVLASGAVLLLGTVLKGKSLCDTLSSVEERYSRPADCKVLDTFPKGFSELKKWYFPVDADRARAVDMCEDAARGWPPFDKCNQKIVKTQLSGTQKLSFFLEGSKGRRHPDADGRRRLGTQRRAEFWASRGKPWAHCFNTTKG